MVQRVLSLMVTAVLVSCAAPQDRERSTGASEQEDPEAVISDLESSIPDLMRNARIPGLQIALIRDAEVVWEDGFGITDSESSNPVTADTIFEAASLTKPVFAYAVMQMVDEGLVDLDWPIVAYLTPEEVAGFLGHPTNADGFRADWFETITARQVLSHSAGMPHGEGGAIYPLAFEPGTDWTFPLGTPPLVENQILPPRSASRRSLWPGRRTTMRAGLSRLSGGRSDGEGRL